MTSSRFPTDRSKSALELVASGALDDSVAALYLDEAHTQRLIPSSSKPGAFYITSTDACTCPDSQYRKAVCKHQIATRLADVLATAEMDNAVLTVTDRKPLTRDGHPELARILGTPHTNGRVIPASQIERED